ncbi:hypothetical protein D3C84_356810 [compost metagenome]
MPGRMKSRKMRGTMDFITGAAKVVSDPSGARIGESSGDRASPSSTTAASMANPAQLKARLSCAL